MRGAETILAMRRRGMAPTGVTLTLEPDATWRDWWLHGTHATVCIEPADSIRLLDLRFLVGLACWPSGYDERRVQLLHRACIDAGAKRVISAVFERTSWGDPRTVAVLDSDELFTHDTRETQEAPCLG